MDELTRYILHNYGHLMTPAEKKASFGVGVIAQLSSGRKMALSEIDEDREVRELAKEGREVLNAKVVKRILADHPTEVVLNRCPKCDKLVATPRAKMCLHCGFDWHTSAK